MVYDRECESTHRSLPNDVMKMIRDSEGDGGGGEAHVTLRKSI